MSFNEEDLQQRIPQGWHIRREMKPIPDRRHDYDFWHDDVDLDSDLYGTAESVEDALLQIAEIEADQ